MPERKILAKIIKITDDDTGMYRIGEIDGGFPKILEIDDHTEDNLVEIAHNQRQYLIGNELWIGIY